MRSKLAMLCLLLSVSCGKAEDGTESSLQSYSTPAPSFEDRTLDRVSFVTTHNSFFQGYFKLIVGNQNHTIKEQLARGVRGFMLDIWSKDNKAVLCHSKCEVDILISKVDLSQSLTGQFKVYEDFLKKNPKEIVTISLEWTTSARANEFRDALNQFPLLKSMIFDPYKANVRSNGWPKVKDMIKDNKRLLILAQTDSVRDMGVGYDRDFTVENYWSMGIVGEDRACRSRWDDIPLDRDNTQANKFRRLFVMNHFRDVSFTASSAIDNTAESLWNRIANQCLQSSRRIPNFVAVDYYDIGGVFSFVKTLNEAVGIAFSDKNWGGKAQMMTPSKRNMRGGDGELANDTMSSAEIFFKGTGVDLFDNDDQVRFMTNINESTGDLREFNDRVSSWQINY